MATSRICSVDGCGKKIYCRELCSAHYQRLQTRGGDFMKPRPRPTLCKADGCGRPNYAKGLCSSHYRKSKPQCSIEGCEKPSKTRGMCIMHEKRVAKHGDPLFEQPDPLNWLRAHCAQDGDECLPWPFGRSDKGYGTVLTEDGETAYAHRLMCKLAHGDAPVDKPHALHSCNRGKFGCVAPNHLRWGSHAENMRDRVDDGTSNRGERNHSAKLTADRVLQIRDISTSMPVRHVARAFGVSPMTINDIRARRTWAWLTG